MKILLFGPPGVGKSTTIKWLNDAGIQACDLEDVEYSKRVAQLLTSSYAVYAAADINPRAEFPSTYKVLLTMRSEALYRRRRLHRDRRDSSKATQRIHTLKEWEDAAWMYDAVLYADDSLLHELSDLILNLFHEPVLLAERGQTSR